MSEYEQGSMDTTEQVKTFDGFVKITTWVSVIVVCILVFLAIVGT